MLTIQNNTGVVLAYLNNLTEAKIHEVLNGEYTLSFVAIIDHLKTDYLYDNDNLINYEDDLFRVVELTELHNEDDEITVAVTAEHISYDLINNVMSDFNYTYRSASEVMTQCLLGTDFNLRSCDVIGKTDIQYTEECNSKQISIAIANNWKGELRYYKHYIDLLQMRGTNRGVDFRFGKNLKSIKRLINFAEDTLSYEVDVVQGSELEELGYFELGDTIRVIDDRLNADYEVRIIDLEKDILEGINSKIVLGDAIKDMRSTFSKVKQDVEEVKQTIEESAADWDKIKDITNENGDIILGKLNSLTNIASKIVNSTGTFLQMDNGLYWQDQPTKEASTFATFWGAQGLTFANSKLPNGEWIWQTALDSNGLIATSVTSSCLNAITANVINLVVDNLIGKTITGVTIEGSTIYAGDRKNGTYTVIKSNGDINRYIKNVHVAMLSGYEADGGGELWLNAFDGSGSIHIDTNIYTQSNERMGRIEFQGLAGMAIRDGNTGSNINIMKSGTIQLMPSNRMVYIEGDLQVAGTIDSN